MKRPAFKLKSEINTTVVIAAAIPALVLSGQASRSASQMMAASIKRMPFNDADPAQQEF